LVENSWHIDRCLGKAIDTNSPPPYFKQFFDLRKEFKKSFKLNANLNGMIDFFQLKKGYLFAPIEYCEVVYSCICKMVEAGHYFKKCELAVFAEESCVLKLRGLPWQATESDIVEFFNPQRITSLEFILNNQGAATGEAFVIFADPSCAQKGLELDQSKMGRRYIEIFPSSVDEMNHALHIMVKNLQMASVLRMRGLPYNVTTSDILSFFEGLEIIEGGIWIDIDQNGKPNGTAYIQFPSISLLNEALKRNKEKLGNRYIELFRSSQDELMAKVSQFEQPQVSPFICRLSNFPKAYEEVEIANFFHGLNIRSQGIHLVFNERNESTGEGFIEFEKEDDLIFAVKKSGNVLEEQVIQILKSDPYEMLSSHQQ
jgi:RNA recognition motif-containing protein